MRASRTSAMPARQRGVALITAVLIVALATILAINVTFRGMVDQRRSANLFALDTGYEIALGAEAWAADFLRKDAQESQTDHLAETWAQPLPPLPVGEGIGVVEGRLEDMAGRFNINNLINPMDGTTDPKAVKQLERLLGMRGIEIEPTWAAAIADWVDADLQPGFPDGAEDSTYTGQDPPHLAANMPVTRISELMVLPGFGIERFRKLKPYIAALPVGTKLNVCTALPPVLDSLFTEDDFVLMRPEDLAARRKEGCFPTLDSLQSKPGFDQIREAVGETSNYFGATVWVTIGTTQFTLYSLLARGGNGPVRPVLRSFGAE
jgi:general secretion pathway protein K